MNAFSVGNLVGKSFRIWWKNLGLFTLLALLVYVPVFGLLFAAGFGELLMLEPGQVPAATPSFGGIVGAYLVGAVLFTVYMAALTYGALQTLAGRPVRLGELLGVGVRRALPVVAGGLVVYLLMLIGFVFLIVPGIILACAAVATIPAIVVEGAGPVAGIRRSFQLTKGRRLAIFAAFVVFFLVVMGASMLGNLAVPILAVTGSTNAVIGAFVVMAVVQVLIASLPTIAPAVAYHDLRAEKEGVGTADLVKVFE